MVKKWDIEIIKVKLNNLKKIISAYEIEQEIAYCKVFTDDEKDFLNMAYYRLKERHIKYNRGIFGTIKMPTYKPKNHGLYSRWDEIERITNYLYNLNQTQTSDNYRIESFGNNFNWLYEQNYTYNNVNVNCNSDFYIHSVHNNPLYTVL